MNKGRLCCTKKRIRWRGSNKIGGRMAILAVTRQIVAGEHRYISPFTSRLLR
jgi:hypothetical protein